MYLEHTQFAIKLYGLNVGAQSSWLALRHTMQYFHCCPIEGNDAIESTLTIQHFPARTALIAAPNNNTSYNKRQSMESSSTAAWSATECNSPVNPYHVLELRRDATPSEIIGSYRKLALMYHPGRKISCPFERKKRIQFFEVLGACYETLMHSEFRRKCDVLLKDIEKKQNSKTNRKMTRSSYKTKAIISEGTTTIQQPHQMQSESRDGNTMSNALVIRGVDSLPGLIPSSSDSSSASGGDRSRHPVENSGESNETPMRNYCTSLGGILTCSAGPGALEATSSNTNSFTISRDGTKGFKSLMDSSSLSASNSHASVEEEAEIHFSEATVNRLFGGPLASLHRARNFQVFSDPYLVFDKVFGNQKPIFPRVTIADINAIADEIMDEGGNFHNNSLENCSSFHLIRSSTSQFSQPVLEPFSTSKKNQSKIKNDSFDDNNGIDQTANTKVFISSRIVNRRKITKTETVHVDPATGIASVNVTVDGEYLEPVRSKKKTSQNGSSVADWLLCFGSAKVTPAPSCTNTAIENLTPPKPSLCCPKNGSECRPAEKLSSSCHSFKSLYVEALEEFYLRNNNFYEECDKYMRCGT